MSALRNDSLLGLAFALLVVEINQNRVIRVIDDRHSIGKSGFSLFANAWDVKTMFEEFLPYICVHGLHAVIL